MYIYIYYVCMLKLNTINNIYKQITKCIMLKLHTIYNQTCIRIFY